MSKFNARSLDAKTIFYLKLIGDSRDGSADLTSEVPDGFATLDEAVAHAKEEAYGGCLFIIYECRPVRKIVRGPVRVTSIVAREPAP